MRPGKTPVSCVPCAKRKVRCDKQLPCCHCKRRPQDACHYPTPVSSPDSPDSDLEKRIRELEQHIKALGGNPKEAHQHPTPSSTPGELTRSLPTESTIPEKCYETPATTSPESRTVGKNSGLVVDDEESSYIEAPMWYSWRGETQPDDDVPILSSRGNRPPPSAARSNYLPSILEPAIPIDNDGQHSLQIPSSHLNFLWKTFLKNVHPLTKIFFDWEIEPIIKQAREADLSLSSTDKALLFSIVFMSVIALSESECTSHLHDEKALLLDRFQKATENALLLVGYAWTTNKHTLQALMLYTLAMSERAHPATIYSLLGVATRVAERMGFHRDGELLGLDALRSEERRRIWWQLQYMEITSARFVGALSMTVFSSWDARMPANLEDADLIGADASRTLPPERTKLTSMSHCRWVYRVLSMNRALHQPTGNGGTNKSLAWALSPNISLAEKDAVIDEFEKVLRSEFLQYCEPLNPLHVNIQLSICQYVLAGRRLMRQPTLINARISEMSRRERDEFLEICTKSLEYGNMTQTNPMLKGYLWYNRVYFPWVAFVYVILESHHRSNEPDVADLWDLIQRTYMAYPELSTTSHRQDITFAARITLASWKKHAAIVQKERPAESQEPPSWILELCESFDIPKPSQPSLEWDEQVPLETFQVSGVDFDFDMVDWSSFEESFMSSGLYTKAG